MHVESKTQAQISGQEELATPSGATARKDNTGLTFQHTIV